MDRALSRLTPVTRPPLGVNPRDPHPGVEFDAELLQVLVHGWIQTSLVGPDSRRSNTPSGEMKQYKSCNCVPPTVRVLLSSARIATRERVTPCPRYA